MNTRPNLSFALKSPSQFMQNPKEPDLQALHNLLRFASGTDGQENKRLSLTQVIL